MTFEGSEKKLEVSFSSEAGNLRSRGEEYWSRLVQSVGAKILSKLNRGDCDAYLLSESSLFVWDNKLIMITCGQTRLVQALLQITKDFPAEQIEALVYERKNEYYPRLQDSDFAADVELIKQKVPGQAYQFGHTGEHHVFLFHLDRQYKPSRNDVTTELLMNHIGGVGREVFTKSGQTTTAIREFLKLDQIFPDYAWDDHVFEPFGYSVNGIKQKRYVTIHVTPQEGGSYVSFETNVDFGESLVEVLSQVIQRFQPKSFDVMSFRPDDKTVDFNAPDYWRVNRVQEKLKNGFRVAFTSHYLTHAATQSAQNFEA